ncbi:MAG: hypothetical protein JO264_05370 [Acidisphaera sp.]|nr:hypothetical protein [Acidisphaera sp.]
MTFRLPRLRSLLGAASLGAALLPIALPSPAHAWWRGGVWIGVPFPGVVIAPPVYAPPVYAPPPVVYAPQQEYYGQDQGYAPAAPSGATCYAGQYVCPLQRPVPSGTTCSCPGNAGRVFGRSG